MPLAMVGALDHVQVDTPVFVVEMVLAFLVIVWAAIRYRRASNLAVRYGLRGAVLGLFVLTGLAWANAYFAYIPTLGGVLGRRAADQASAASLKHALVSARQFAVAKVPGEIREIDVVGPGRHEPLSGDVVFESSVMPAAKPAAPSLPPHGLVELINIPPTVSGFHARAAEVYLPPAWFDPTRPALPVIMLLQGTPGTPADWTRGGEADLTVDAWAALHHGAGPILVMPDPNGSPFGDTECVDGRQGAAETYLTQDVRNYVIKAFGAASDRSSWAVGGLSEGGLCAISMTMRHPDLFSTFLAFGADDHLTHDGGLGGLFRGRAAAAQAEAYAPRTLLAEPPSLPVAAWFGTGQADGGPVTTATRMDALARQSGIDSHLELIPGAHHTFRVWRDGFAQALPWVLGHLRAIAYPPPERQYGPAIKWTPVPRHARRKGNLGDDVATGGPTVMLARDDMVSPDENPLGRRVM